MRMSAIAICAAALTGCAAQLTFIDRADGQLYQGQTGNTTSSSGNATATIAGASYSGPWVFSQTGGSYTLGNMNTLAGGTAVGTMGTATAVGSSTSTMSAFTTSAQGRGLMNLRSADGSFVRCVFDFNTWSNTGIGQCVRNDGREFDLTLKR